MTVCLAMMAKAPADVVCRAVESACPYIDALCLVVAPGDPLTSFEPPPWLPTRIIEEPWQGYAATRTLTLQHAESDLDVDWILMIDAYCTVRGQLPELNAENAPDAYEVAVFDPASRWRWMRSGHLMRARRGFRWDGAVHETMVVPEGRTVRTWQRLEVSGTASPKNGATGRTYDDDAAVLDSEIAKDPTNTRAAFYLAQSLKDAGRYSESYEAFGRRSEMGGWDEEVFWSLMWRGNLAGLIGRDRIVDYEIAHAHSPHRAEPLAGLSFAHWLRGELDASEAFAVLAHRCPFPIDARLFVDTSAYSPQALAAIGR